MTDFSQFSNAILMKKLFRKENIDILAEIIQKRKEELLSLPEESNKELSIEEIREEFPRVKIFREGHAIGVENAVTQQEINPKNTFHKKLRIYDLELAFNRLLHEQGYNVPPVEISYHGLGDALFAITERKHGKDIYRDALRGKNIFA